MRIVKARIKNQQAQIHVPLFLPKKCYKLNRFQREIFILAVLSEIDSLKPTIKMVVIESHLLSPFLAREIMRRSGLTGTVQEYQTPLITIAILKLWFLLKEQRLIKVDRIGRKLTLKL